MSSKYLAAALFGVALMSAPALAQTTTPTPDAITNISQVEAGQWRSSKLIGVSVYNNSNEKIGDISDLLVDQDGKIQAVILGVGGFLGMGEHLVAVKFENLKWVNEPVRNTTTSSSASPAPNSTGNRATTGSSVPHTPTSNAEKMYPDHAVLNATKDRLKAMPAFNAVSAQ